MRQFCLLLTLTTVYVQAASLTYNGKTYPEPVQLAYQFHPLSFGEQSGGTCAVETGLALAEAACYRRTSTLSADGFYLGGRSLRFSRAAMFYNVIAARVREKNTRLHPQTVADPSLTGQDGSMPEESVAIVSSGSALQDSENTHDVDLFDTLGDFTWRESRIFKKGLDAAPDPAGFTAAYDTDFTRRWVANMGQIVYEHWGPAARRSADGRIGTDVYDPELKRCLDNGGALQGQRVKYSLTRALDLLSRGIPFGCDMKNFRLQPADEGIGPHIVSVIGYRYRVGATNNVEFWVKNSYSGLIETMDIADCDLYGMYVVQ